MFGGIVDFLHFVAVDGLIPSVSRIILIIFNSVKKLLLSMTEQFFLVIVSNIVESGLIVQPDR